MPGSIFLGVVVFALAMALSGALAASAYAQIPQETALSGSTLSVASNSSGKASIASAKVAKMKALTYTGKKRTPKPKVTYGGKTLKLGRDYVLKYKNNLKAGIATLFVKGKGDFTGSKKVAFRIRHVSVATAKMSKVSARMYTGNPIKPKFKVKAGGKLLKRGRDYRVFYKANREIGRAHIVIKGKGNYCGRKEVTFKIVEWVQKLNVAKTTNQLIVVAAHGTQADVSLHVKTKGFWRQKLWTDEGWIGASGLGLAHEGSSCTPTGVLYPDMAFGIQEDPGCKMGYTQADWSNYWCGDSNSWLYNKWVSTYDTTDFDMGESEHIISCGYAYNYCLNMGWNAECVPYAGSAFFLHCSTGGPTAGCVSVPEWAMIEILRAVEPGCAILIDAPEALGNY